MLVHLGMTGKFFLVNKKDVKLKTSFYYDIDEKESQKHDHIIFFFSKRCKLIYNDVRKFGFIKLLSNKKFKDNFHLKHLGPEPLKNAFNCTYFKNYIKGRNRVIKDVLMDQKFVSGLGNIYANEILFLSKVKPSRKVKNLKEFELKKIINFTKEVLKNAIELGGSSIKDFSSSNGKKGSFQQYFNVYGKKGATCSNTTCKSIIVKSSISNRSTFFCDNCQK